MAVPERTDEQRRAALARAQEVRSTRASIKQMLKTGEVTLADLLARVDDNDVVAGMPVSDVLRALPRMGPVRSRRLMERLDIAASRRLGGLGHRQRRALLDELS